MLDFDVSSVLLALFLVTQCLYLLSLTIDFYFYTRPVDRVDANPIDGASLREYPKIILLYPVLRESDATMRTTLSALRTGGSPPPRGAVREAWSRRRRSARLQSPRHQLCAPSPHSPETQFFNLSH